MIRIVYEPNEFTLTISGHAQTAPKGQDLICAWVSALTEAMLRRVEGRRVWQPAYGVNKEKATVRVRLTPRTKYAEETAREMLATVCAGYQAIAEEYPENVRFEVR